MIKVRLNTIKAANGCVLCEENDPVCLEFHHLDPREKDFYMGNARRKRWRDLISEMKKCTVLCSNCHKKVHARGTVIDPSMACDPDRVITEMSRRDRGVIGSAPDF